MSVSWIELDLRGLRRNLRALKAGIPSGAKLMMSVKADAYGHGVADVATGAWAAGVKWFIVSSAAEGAAVRGHLPEARILIDGVASRSDVPAMTAERMAAVIHAPEQAQELARGAAASLCAGGAHGEIDTGFGQSGRDWESARETLPRLARLPGIKVQGVCSRFAVTGRPDDSFPSVQLARFYTTVKVCRDSGMRMLFRHMADDDAILRNLGLDMEGVRAGMLTYGYFPKHAGRPLDCRPFMEWKTRVLQVRDVPKGFSVGGVTSYATAAPTRLAVVAVGYADGFPRRMNRGGHVLIHGRPCPVAGPVGMELTTVDAGDDRQVNPGDEVVLIGAHQDRTLWADRLAAWCETTTPEILSGIRTNTRREIVRRM